MKRKIAASFAALVLCMGLSMPALADYTPYTISESVGKEVSLSEGYAESGSGWSYDGNKLTLNGFHGAEIYCEYGTAAIALAPGSMNTVQSIWFGQGMAEEKPQVSFEGNGELVICGADPNQPAFFCETGTPLTLKDGLVMTGGTSEDDRGALTLNQEGYPAFNGRAATYVRISPAAGSGTQIPTASTGFTDVAANSPYADAIKWAVEQNIAKGKTATAFDPNGLCTIAHIVTFQWRAAKSPGATGNDIQDALAWAAGGDLGLLARTDDINAPCARHRAVFNLWLAAGEPKASKTVSFSDIPAGAYYAPAVSWAVEKGITHGTSDTTFSPNNPCTRGQIVTFLYRSLNL